MIEQLKYHEGFRAKPYKCTMDYLTIGYGTNLETRGITEAEAEMLLLNDLAEIEQRLDKLGLLSGHNDARRAALINMGYQLGVAGLLNFKNMLGFMRDKNYRLAADEALDSRWSMQTPNRAKEIAEQIRSGEWQ